jgi:WD40 repeat protein
MLMARTARMQASETAATLIGHAGRVNCVKWWTSLSGSRGEAPSLLASGSADGAVILWSIDLSNGQSPWRIVAVLKVLLAFGPPSPSPPTPQRQYACTGVVRVAKRAPIVLCM